MTSKLLQTQNPQSQAHVVELIQHLSRAKADLEAALQGQIDAVIDPLTSSIILLGHAQEAVQFSEIRHWQLLLHMTALIFELEPDGTIRFASDSAFDLLGYAPNELQGQNWWTLLCGTMSTAQIEAITEQLRAGDVADAELTVTHKDGSLMILKLDSANRYDTDGSLSRIVGLAINITERKQLEHERKIHSDLLEQTIIDRTKELTRANRLLRREILERQRAVAGEHAAQAEVEKVNQIRLKYLAMISHELRTPLTSIKGFASTLLAKDVTWNPESEREFIKIINSEADKLTELIDQLIDLSRLNAGTLRLYRSPVFARDIAMLILPQLEKLTSKHLFRLEIPAGLPYITADSRRIGQTFMRLVDNAAKFSPAGTSIILSATAQDAFVEFRVSDQGPGIPPENRERVFEAFWALSEIKSINTKGAGLGLAFCKGLIESHGGKIWIADQQEPGTTIGFTLPFAPSDRLA